MIPLNVAATLAKVGSAATGNDFASEQGGDSETYVLWDLLICSLFPLGARLYSP